MGASKYRKLLHDRVHERFAEPATYAPPVGAPISITARLLRGEEVIGDLDREGYAQISQDSRRIVFNRNEIVPVEKAIVTFEDPLIGSFRIDLISEPENDEEIVAEVLPL